MAICICLLLLTVIPRRRPRDGSQFTVCDGICSSAAQQPISHSFYDTFKFLARFFSLKLNGFCQTDQYLNEFKDYFNRPF